MIKLTNDTTWMRLREEIGSALSGIFHKEVEISPIASEPAVVKEAIGSLSGKHIVLKGKVTVFERSLPWLAIIAEDEAAKLCAIEPEDTQLDSKKVVASLKSLSESVIDAILRLRPDISQVLDLALTKVNPLDGQEDTSLFDGFDEQGNAIMLQHRITVSDQYAVTVAHLLHPELLNAFETEYKGEEEDKIVDISDKSHKRARPIPPSPSIVADTTDSEEHSSVRSVQFLPFANWDGKGEPNSIDFVLDISLKITVELGRTYLPIREILELSPGSVIELDKVAGEPVHILANGRVIARGEVVVVDENFGVRIIDIVSSPKRLATTG